MSRTDDIQSDIERTRGEMAGTLQAIERKLSPNRLMDEAMKTMNATLTQTRLLDLVRDNPVPLALVGLGLGWLTLSSLRGGNGESAEDYGEAGYAGPLSNAVEQVEDWAGYGAGTGDTVRRAAGEVGDRVQEGARSLASVARSQARDLTRRVSGVTRQAGDVFQDHPLTIGLFAVVAGVALGAALPRTRRETELLGDTGTDVLQRAGRAVRRAADAVTDTGAEALQRAKEAVREGGAATTH